MPHADFFWAYRFLKVKLSDTQKLTMVAAECSKIFDVQCIGGGTFMSPEKILFLSICRLYLI